MCPGVISKQISGQIDRILHSQTFANKRQLRRLLEVLVAKMDSQETLTAELIIGELWPDETRTKRSADVATEMNRLRRALKTYYQSEGDGDPVDIYLPNRAVTAGDGAPQRPWIVAKSHLDLEDDSAASRCSNLRAWPQLVLVSAIAAAFAIVGFFSIRMLTPTPQPRSGRLDGKVLRVMDRDGKELWSKDFPQGFGPELYYEKNNGTRIWFADLEGKGHTSVLFSYLPAPDFLPHSSTLICYSDQGKEKWRWSPGRKLPGVGGPASYKTFSVGVLKAKEKGRPRIAVLSDLDPWWAGPSQIAILDSNGKALSEYWHSGGLRDMALADLDGDGREEIIATGVAHGFDAQATLVVLDSERVSGASKEVQPDSQIHGVGIAQERLRLLFPRSDLNRASFRFNMATEPTVEHGNLRLKVLECLAPVGCPVRYEFDKDFHLIAASPASEEFSAAHDRFYQSGKDAHSLSAEDRAAFLRVRCLVGCPSEFVPVAETYDPAASFEKGWTTHSNPNSVWSYGYSSGFAGAITLYDQTVQNGINGPSAQYWLSSSVNAGTSPAAEYNNGPAFNDGNVAFLPNEFLLVAGIHGQYSDLVFTAPAGGEYSIAGSFRGAQYGIGTVVGIVVNGKVIFKSSVTAVGQLAPFHLMLNLQAGSTVAFSAGPGGGSQNTGLSATITKPCSLSDKPAASAAGEITCSAPVRMQHDARSPR
jgi:hypothetical protein